MDGKENATAGAPEGALAPGPEVGLWWHCEGGDLELDAVALAVLGLEDAPPPRTMTDLLAAMPDAAREPLLEVLEEGFWTDATVDRVIGLPVPDGAPRSVRWRGRRLPRGPDGAKLVGGVCHMMPETAGSGGADVPPPGNGESAEEASGAFARFYELTNDLYCVAGFDGYFIQLNPAWERALGHTRAFLRSQPFFNLIHPDDVERTRSLMGRIVRREALEGGTGGVDGFENRFRCADGSYRWLSWSWITDGRAERITAVARDVTERRELESRLTAALERTRESNRELENFASVASHDLREPLRAVSGYLKLLRENNPEALDASGREYVELACGAADRMREMINALLAYARLDGGIERTEVVALRDVVADASANVEAEVARCGADLSVDVGRGAEVRGSRTHLSRLMQNLFANALKFRDPGRAPRVAVRCVDGAAHGAPGCWVLSVEDNGIGIDPDHGELLFQLFRRVHGSDAYEGAGIGLAVCRKIASLHGGRIWFASEPGSGSTFFVALPKNGEAALRG